MLYLPTRRFVNLQNVLFERICKFATSIIKEFVNLQSVLGHVKFTKHFYVVSTAEGKTANHLE
jgi:hypothetical protein